MDPNPFGSIESAQDFLRLLVEAVQEAQLSFADDVTDSEPIDEQSRARRLEAMELVTYKRLLLRERALQAKSVKPVRSMKS